MHPKGIDTEHHYSDEYINYRSYGIILLTIAFILVYYLYKNEPQIHIYSIK